MVTSCDFSDLLPNNRTKLTLTLPIGFMGFDYEPKFNYDASGEITGAQFSRWLSGRLVFILLELPEECIL